MHQNRRRKTQRNGNQLRLYKTDNPPFGGLSPSNLGRISVRSSRFERLMS